MLDFIERHLGVSRDGRDQSLEMMILVLAVLLVFLGGMYWADRRQPK